jgi:hypothetical protein
MYAHKHTDYSRHTKYNDKQKYQPLYIHGRIHIHMQKIRICKKRNLSRCTYMGAYICIQKIKNRQAKVVSSLVTHMLIRVYVCSTHTQEC